MPEQYIPFIVFGLKNFKYCVFLSSSSCNNLDFESHVNVRVYIYKISKSIKEKKAKAKYKITLLIKKLRVNSKPQYSAKLERYLKQEHSAKGKAIVHTGNGNWGSSPNDAMLEKKVRNSILSVFEICTLNLFYLFLILLRKLKQNCLEMIRTVSVNYRTKF